MIAWLLFGSTLLRPRPFIFFAIIFVSIISDTLHCQATMADESWSWEADWVPPEDPEEGILAIGNRDSAFFKDR